MSEDSVLAEALAATCAPWWLVREAVATTDLDKDETCTTYTLPEENPVSDHDHALVDNLAKVAADALAWDWPAVPIEHIPSPTECTTDVVVAILDRLTELGWRPSCGHRPDMPEGLACFLPAGHIGAHRDSDNDTRWGAAAEDPERRQP